MGDLGLVRNLQQRLNKNNKGPERIFDKSTHKIGKNKINMLNGRIRYDWMNLTKEAFKLKCNKNNFDLNNIYQCGQTNNLTNNNCKTEPAMVAEWFRACVKFK